MSSGNRNADAEGSDPPRLYKRRGIRLVGRTVSLGALTVGLLVGLFVMVFPTRAYLDQRDAISSAEHNIESARAQIAELEDRIDDFNDQTSASRIARERFSLVYEGEELFRLSTRPSAAVDLPVAWMWPGFERVLRGS